MKISVPKDASPLADTVRLKPAQMHALAMGFPLAIATTIIGAVQPVITRYGAVHLNPLLFCTGSVIVSALCLVVVMLCRGELGTLADMRYLPWLLPLSMAGTVMTSLTLVFGLVKIEAIAGVLLLQSEPVYSLLLATLILGERPPMRQFIATAVILAGIGSVFAAGREFSPLYAAISVLLTPLFWQTAHVLSLRVMPPLSPTCITGARYVYAAFVLAVLLLVFDANAIVQLGDPAALAVIAVTGLFVYFLGSLTWYGAISRLSLAWTTALVVPGIPLLSILFAIAFLGEQTSMREGIGIAIAVAGVLALVLGSDPRRQKPAETVEAIHKPIG